MPEEIPHHSDLSPHHQSPVDQQLPHLEQPPPTLEAIVNLTETPQPGITSLEQAIVQATPEAEQAPSWFRRAVKTIADAWFDPKSFESPELYERLGVKTIKDFYKPAEQAVHHLVYKKFGMEKWAQHTTSKPLKSMELFTRFYESVHLASFAALTSFTAEAVVQGRILPAVAYTALNTYFNICPIMLQRYNRMRLYHAIHRMEARNTLDLQTVPHKGSSRTSGAPGASDT